VLINILIRSIFEH